MRHVVVVAFRLGLKDKAGEWNLIHSRNLALQHMGIKVHLLAGFPEGTPIPGHFHCAGYPVEVFTTPVAKLLKPLALRITAVKTASQMAARAVELRPEIVIVTGNIVLPPVVKRLGGKIPLVADVHGTIMERVDYPSPHLRSLVGYLHDTYVMKRYFPRVDGFLVVTDGLSAECADCAPGVPAFVVPCASSYWPTWETVSANRGDWRRKLRVSPDTILLAHAGGLGSYQNPEPLLNTLEAILDSGRGARLLVATRQTHLLDRALAGRNAVVNHSVIARYFEEAEYRQVLAAADIGLVIREQNATNASAFPNKVDEFWSVGVPVLTTPGLPAVARLVRSVPSSGILVGAASGEIGADEIQSITSAVDINEAQRRQRFQEILGVRQKIAFPTTLANFLGTYQ